MTMEDNSGPEPEETLAIGISFGNSNSGIAYTTLVRNAIQDAIEEHNLTCV